VSRLNQLRSSIWLTFRRLRATWALSLAVVLSLSALIGVWVGIPLYAESASARLLSVEVDDAAADDVPFGYLFSYNRLSGGNQSWSDFEVLNQLIDGPDAPFGSNVSATRRLITSVTFDLIVPNDADATVARGVSFASASGFDGAATLTQGRQALPARSLADPIEVMIDEDFAERNGISAGQRLQVLNRRVDLDDPNRAINIEITGLWAAPEQADPESRFLRNGSLSGNLVVPEATISMVVDPLTDASLSNAQWLVLLDSSTVTTDSVDELLARTESINRRVDDALRGARLLVSPESSLENFQDDVADLNRGLTLFSLPTLALVVAVAGLMISMRWARRLGEVAMLRRRGVPAGQIIGETFIEALVLAVACAIVGLGAARLVASLMGRTETFLRIGEGVDLELVMNSRSWRALVVALIVVVALLVAPSFSALRDRLLSVTPSSNALERRPWWQRTRLDLAIIVGVAFFTWFLLRRDALRGDLLDDPIVILLPAINAFAIGLVVLRLLPRFSGGIARGLERTNSTAALLVARRSSRVPSAMTAPLLLLVITSALAIYTGSLARTLDLQLFDAAHHSVGAANSVRTDVEDQLGQRFELEGGETVAVPSTSVPIRAETLNRIWGVDAASRLARLPARIDAGPGVRVPVSFTGIDTANFADVAFWRDDYATMPLSDLIARLDATPDSVLLTRSVARQADLQLGDTITLSVSESGRRTQVDLVLVGTFDQFPTWIPGTELPPAVSSLGDYEARAGRTVARELLFNRTGEGVDDAQTRADFSRLGISTTAPLSPDAIIERVQLRPERQGIFGLLTVGFALSAALAVAGFVFYAVFGFTRQLTELGVLRALGLPARGLMVLVTLDLALVAGAGIGIGSLAGLAMARWFLPELVDNPAGAAPQLLQEIDWSAAIGIPLTLAGALAILTVGLLTVLRRIRLFEAVKVGAST